MSRPTIWSPTGRKLLICTVLLIAVGTGTLANNYDDKPGLRMEWFERGVKWFIERVRDTLRKGNSALGIPVLDPFYIKKNLIKINSSIAIGTVDLEDLSVWGMASFTVDDIRLSWTNSTAVVRLLWSGIKSTGMYRLDGTMDIPYTGNIPLYGNGTAKALIHKMWSEIKVRFTSDEKIVRVSELRILWDINNPQIRLDGLFGGLELGNVINDLVEDLIPKLDAAYHDTLQKKLEALALKYINDILSGVKPGESQDPFFAMLQYVQDDL